MGLQVLIWVVAIPLLGFITGMRTMTPLAVISWFAWLGLLPVSDDWCFWVAKFPVVIAFTLLAAAEYTADKLGRSPRPTRPAVLSVRIFLGGLVGAIVAAGLDASSVEGTILGVLGAVVGAFCAYEVRHRLTSRLGCKTWYVTTSEDIFAVGCAILCLGIITS
jgi:uncharacterized membrane protein